MNLSIELNKAQRAPGVGKSVHIGISHIEQFERHDDATFVQLASGKSLRVQQTPHQIDEAITKCAYWYRNAKEIKPV